MGCHSLLQGIFLIQVSNLHLLHWQMDYLPLHHLGSSGIKHEVVLIVDGDDGRQGMQGRAKSKQGLGSTPHHRGNGARAAHDAQGSRLIPWMWHR